MAPPVLYFALFEMCLIFLFGVVALLPEPADSFAFVFSPDITSTFVWEQWSMALTMLLLASLVSCATLAPTEAVGRPD